MDIKKLNEAMDVLKREIGDAVVASDIFTTTDGQSIVGFNTNPEACALFNQITTYLMKALGASGFPELGQYYMINLVGGNIVIIVPLGDYQWQIYVDGRKTQLGLILNLAIPKAIDAFEEALTG